MKKFYFILAVYSLILTCNLKAQTNSIKVSSTGLVGINLATPLYQLDVSGKVQMAYNGRSILFDGAAFMPSPSLTLDLGLSGNYWNRLYASVAFFNSQPVIGSDEKIKTNIMDLPLMKDKVKLLRPVSYNLKSDIIGVELDPAIRGLQYGFIAQEFQKVFPDMVNLRDDGMLGIRYSELIPVLVQALKEQQDQIDALTKRIADLEAIGK
jgi:hypothetical protein